MPIDMYHKIQSVYLRDISIKSRPFLIGQFSEDAFEYLEESPWEWTEKVDGTNVRVIWDGSGVTFGGRTENAQLHVGLVNHLKDRYTAEILRAVFDDVPVMLCGEGFGDKIQKNGGRYRTDQSFVLFDVRIGDAWARRENVEGIASALGCECVPIVGKGTISQAIEWVKDAPKSTWGNFVAEGLVLRPPVELLTRRGERVITKIKVKDFPGAD